MRSKSIVLLVAIVSILLACGAGVVVASEGEAKALEISLADYVTAYIRNSDAVEQAYDRVDSAVESLERAVAEKKASLSIEELANAVDTQRLALQEARNNAAIQAIQSYSSLAQTIKDTDSKRGSLAVAEERLRVTRLRHEAGFVTADQLLQQQSSYLSAADALIKAEQSLEQAIESFCESAGIDPAGDVALLTDIAALYTGVPEFELQALVTAARAASSTYFSALKAEELARKKYEALQDPLIATKVERDTAKDTLDDAVKKLQDADKSVIDSVESALSQLESLARALEMQELSTELADNSLEIAKIRFEHGEAYKYELDSEIISNATAHDRLNKAREDVFLQILRIHSLTGEDILGLI